MSRTWAAVSGLVGILVLAMLADASTGGWDRVNWRVLALLLAAGAAVLAVAVRHRP